MFSVRSSSASDLAILASALAETSLGAGGVNAPRAVAASSGCSPVDLEPLALFGDVVLAAASS